MLEKQAMLPKPYRYRIPPHRMPRFDVNRLPTPAIITDPKPLTGYVNGLAATDIEERFARALRNHKRSFRFQVPFPTPPGFGIRYKIVDFVVQGGLTPEFLSADSDQELDRFPENSRFGYENLDIAKSYWKREKDKSSVHIRYPVEIYGKLAHEGSANQGRDALRESLLNITFRQRGFQPMQIIWYWGLETQELADRTVRTMFA